MEAIARDERVQPLRDLAEDPLEGLTDAERTHARLSFTALRRTREQSIFTRWKPVIPMALATVLVLVILAPSMRRHSLVYDLQVGSPLVMRSVEEASPAAKHGLSFRLRRAGHPVLVHVDGEGAARLIYPAPGEGPSPRQADQLILLPPPGVVPEWRSDLAPGRETYLLAVFDAGAPPGQQELASLPRLGPGLDREETIRRVRKALGAGGSTVVRRNGDDN